MNESDLQENGFAARGCPTIARGAGIVEVLRAVLAPGVITPGQPGLTRKLGRWCVTPMRVHATSTLVAYKVAHGDNVPQCWAEDPRLSKWVSEQR
jgi:hypothetical protein